MSDKASHKRQILQDLSTILFGNDDLAPDEVGYEGPDYDRWSAARNELVNEFERRSRRDAKKIRGRRK